jgi:mRNA turnover protein 4
MPRARRNKVVSLTKTNKKTRVDKESLMDKVREAAQQYSFVWLFSIGNMRNAYLKEVRQLWDGSRLFYGKLGVIKKALGTQEEDEARPGLSGIANKLAGPVGLLLTDSTPAEVKEWFDDYSRKDFARAGNLASATVELPAGEFLIEKASFE